MEQHMETRATQSLRLLLQSVVYWLRAVWRVARSSPALFVIQVYLAAQCFFVWGVPFLFDPTILSKAKSYDRLLIVASFGPFQPTTNIGLLFCGLGLAYLLTAWQAWPIPRIVLAFLQAGAFSFLSKMINDANPGTTGSRNYFLVSFLALWLLASLIYDYTKVTPHGRSNAARRVA